MCNKATIARAVDSIRVGSAVQQQLDDGYSVGTSVDLLQLSRQLIWDDWVPTQCKNFDTNGCPKIDEWETGRLQFIPTSGVRYVKAQGSICTCTYIFWPICNLHISIFFFYETLHRSSALSVAQHCVKIGGDCNLQQPHNLYKSGLTLR